MSNENAYLKQIAENTSELVLNASNDNDNYDRSVSVSNFPSTQAVVGSVSVSNFPATQAISGIVGVANFPATQAISGIVGVANFPATQSVSGNVAVSNFPTTQPVSATTLPLPTGAATDSTAIQMRDRIPPLGQNTAANSTPVTLPTDGVFATYFGSPTDAAATSDTASVSFVSLFKRLLGRFSNLLGLLPTALSSAGRFLVDASIANFQDAALITESPLTAVGSTSARSVSGYKSFTYQVDLSNVGTSVTVRMEGNLTGSAYDNLNPSNTDTTLTTNKTYLFSTDLKINNVRMTLVSISGGSPALQCYLLRGN